MSGSASLPCPVDFGPTAAGPGFLAQRIDYAPGYDQPPHSHELTGLTLVLGGDFREWADGREEFASALSVVVKPAGTVHADRVGPAGARTVLVEIEDDLLPESTGLGPWRWVHAGPGVRPLLELHRALTGPDGGTDPAESVAELLGEMTEAAAPTLERVPGWVRRAREALDDRAPEAARVEDLARGLGVHPVSLTRAFRRAYGLPVTGYRRRLRLRRAVSQVVGGDRPLTEIAHAAGYADQAHMCREVRQATRLSPSRLRQAARG